MKCARCHGLGLYADPRCMVDGRRMAMGAKRSGFHTVACPECGANASPMKHESPAEVVVGSTVTIGKRHPRADLRGRSFVVTSITYGGTVKFDGGAASPGFYVVDR